jgi:GT2 family glycosyltransferase
VGVVAIGRNEGVRLVRCFESLPGGLGGVVYVDSGSTDDSVGESRRRGIEVVALDMSTPFTAARARNAGFQRLRQLDPGIELVQFVDGDCELAPGWIEAAAGALGGDARIAAVSGRLRERFRDATVYNLLCDLEWETPVGELFAVGGNAMMRISALDRVGGFDGALISGEEPELCVRLRAQGYRIMGLGAEMALHDAAMTRFGQWWKRSTRTGYGYAELGELHAGLWRRERRSILLWGAALPAAMLAAAALAGPTALALFLVYPAQAARIALRRRARGDGLREAALYGAFCVLAKAPEVQGIARYWWARWRGARGGLIEYK